MKKNTLQGSDEEAIGDQIQSGSFLALHIKNIFNAIQSTITSKIKIRIASKKRQTQHNNTYL